MNVLLIAPQDNFGFSVPGFVHAPAPPKTRLEDWARMNHGAWNTADIFIIDAFFSPFCEDSIKPEGIKLLKILRLLGYKQHCIIYSVYSLEELLLDYQYTSILKSQGTTYLQVPCIIDDALCEAKIDLLCEEDMVPFFKAEAMEWMGTKRHSLANWWGVLRVYDMLKLCGLIGEDSSSGVQEALWRDSSYEGLLMNYLRFRGPRPVFFLNESKAKVQREHMQVLWRKELKVVYVDDHADDGWAYLLQMILYGRERPDLFIAPQLPREGIDLETLTRGISTLNPDLLIVDIRLEPKDEIVRLSELSGIKLIKGLVGNNSVCCPVLVFTASDKRRVSEKAIESGADVVWTKEGIDEGAHIRKEDYFAFTYSRFQDLIYQLRSLTGYEYTLLYDCLRRIKRIEASTGQYWWQKSRWYLGDSKTREPIKKDYLIRKLLQIYWTHKQYLTVSLSEIRSTVYDMLSFKLCTLMDIFHPSRVEPDGSVVSIKKVVNEDWPRFSAALAYANYLVSERNYLLHLKSSSEEIESDAYRYKKILSSFFDYITMPDPSTSFGSVVGTLEKEVSKNGQVFYHLYSDTIDGSFKQIEHAEKCEALLKGQAKVENVEAAVDKAPSLSYRLGEVGLSTSVQQDWEGFWMAGYKILQTGPWGGYVALYDISPRKGVSFILQNMKDPIKQDTIIFFHVRWIDKDDNYYCAISNVSLNPPESIRHTYWSGTVSRVEEAEDGVYLLLKDIEPPFNVFFWVHPNSINALKNGKKTSRICFRPDWIQEWELKDPSIVKDDLISPRWANW